MASDTRSVPRPSHEFSSCKKSPGDVANPLFKRLRAPRPVVPDLIAMFCPLALLHQLTSHKINS